MTTSPPDRLDRIERILDTLAANQVEERDRRLELRDETRQDAEVLFRTIRQTNETVDRLGNRVDQLGDRLDQLGDRLDQLTTSQEQTQQQLTTLSGDVGELRLTVDTAFQQAEQDRSQAAIDRAEFRSTVTQLLGVLSQRFNGNGRQGE